MQRWRAAFRPLLCCCYTDWLSHLATSPQRQLEISQEAVWDARLGGFLKHRSISSQPVKGLGPSSSRNRGIGAGPE